MLTISNTRKLPAVSFLTLLSYSKSCLAALTLIPRQNFANNSKSGAPAFTIGIVCFIVVVAIVLLTQIRKMGRHESNPVRSTIISGFINQRSISETNQTLDLPITGMDTGWTISMLASSGGSNSKKKKVHLTDEELNKYKIFTLAEATIDIRALSGSNCLILPKETDKLKSVIDEKIKDSNLSFECTFCLEKIMPTDSIRLIPCLHLFHIHCLDSWLSKFSICCPTCRYDLTTRDLT